MSMCDQGRASTRKLHWIGSFVAKLLKHFNLYKVTFNVLHKGWLSLMVGTAQLAPKPCETREKTPLAHPNMRCQSQTPLA